MKIGTRVQATKYFKSQFQTKRGLTGTVIGSMNDGWTLRIKRDGLKTANWYYRAFWTPVRNR